MKCNAINVFYMGTIDAQNIKNCDNNKTICCFFCFVQQLEFQHEKNNLKFHKQEQASIEHKKTTMKIINIFCEDNLIFEGKNVHAYFNTSMLRT